MQIKVWIRTKTDLYSYENAPEKAVKAGDDIEELQKAYAVYESDPTIVNLISLRRLVSVYHPVKIADQSTRYAVFSPYFGIDDFRWFLKQLGDLSTYVQLNQQLFDYTQKFDLAALSSRYEMPVYYISGSCDWICPTEPITEYADHIFAPSKAYEILKGPGHNLQYSDPETFAKTIKELID